jgi:hypothetical protein
MDRSPTTTQLFIYNEALGLLGERRLATSSENREPKRVLDSYWNDVVGYCLGQGLWRFAKRAIQTDNDSSITPQWGYNYCFLIPPDWVRTIIISTSPNLDPPLLQYNEEAGYWYAKLRLARKCCFRITGSNGREAELKKDEDRARRVAKAEQAMNDPPGLPPVPFWARARRGAFGPGGLWLGGGTGGSVVTGPQGDD